MDNIRDEILFHRLQSGEEKAFDSLFLRYYPSLCAYARRFVEHEDGQEIVQDVMVWLWENRGMHIVDSSLKSYLFKAVKNRCLTLNTHYEVRQRVLDQLSLERKWTEDSDLYIVEELSRKIEEALQRLPDNYREAFELNRFHHLTYHEIAARLEVSPKTVDYRIRQALKLLRVELKDYLPLLLWCVGEELR